MAGEESFTLLDADDLRGAVLADVTLTRGVHGAPFSLASEDDVEGLTAAAELCSASVRDDGFRAARRAAQAATVRCLGPEDLVVRHASSLTAVRSSHFRNYNNHAHRNATSIRGGSFLASMEN